MRSWMKKSRFLGIFASASAAPALAAIITIFPYAQPALAGNETQIGSATGLPIPRYVSLRSGYVNLRQGPSKEHDTIWIYRKEGLPVEITAEFETWRKIRDSDGSEGWVLHSLLSGRRTALISPWNKDGLIDVRAKPGADAPLAARLEPRVVAQVRKCDQIWCRVSSKEFDGYIAQKELWGVYPDEKLD